jgi:DNA primase
MITNEELQRIREIPITKVLGIQDQGRRRMIKCPFHSDRTASMALYPNGGYHCFGCGKHGKNAIDFVVDLGYTFPQALEELKTYI